MAENWRFARSIDADPKLFIADNICYSLGSKEIPEHRQAMGKDYDSRA